MYNQLAERTFMEKAAKSFILAVTELIVISSSFFFLPGDLNQQLRGTKMRKKQWTLGPNVHSHY